MIFITLVIILFVVASFSYLILSYNFVIDRGYYENINSIYNYKLFQENEKLFNYLLSTEFFDGFAGFIPPMSSYQLPGGIYSGISVFFTGDIKIDSVIYNVNGNLNLNLSGYKIIALRNNENTWKFFYITGLVWFCSGGYYIQQHDFGTRQILLLTGQRLQIQNLSSQTNFIFIFSGNNFLSGKYYYNIYSGSSLLTSGLIRCTNYQDCTFNVVINQTGGSYSGNIFLTGILRRCFP